jgi:hypothetical protein
LLGQVKADLNLTSGEVIMFIPDMPNTPPQDAPVFIAQAIQAQAGDMTKARILGVCIATPNKIYSLSNVIGPVESAGFYLQQYEPQTITGSGPVTTAILQQPKHGILRLITKADGNRFGEGTFDPADPGYAYLPASGYEGKDSATILVDFGGIKVQVKYLFNAISGVIDNEGSGPYCAPKGEFWKISSTLDANGTSTITSVEYQSPVITTTELKGSASQLILTNHATSPTH